MSAGIPIAAISFHIGPYTSYDYILRLSLLFIKILDIYIATHYYYCYYHILILRILLY